MAILKNVSFPQFNDFCGNQFTKNFLVSLAYTDDDFLSGDLTLRCYVHGKHVVCDAFRGRNSVRYIF